MAELFKMFLEVIDDQRPNISIDFTKDRAILRATVGNKLVDQISVRWSWFYKFKLSMAMRKMVVEIMHEVTNEVVRRKQIP